EHLGPMEIQITVKDDRATVWFGASHAETRTALEQALPRLRELLQAQGLTLTDAGVFREPPREQARAYQSSESSSLAGSADGERTVVTINGRSALVDAYA
ncbi:MAG: flagellar hook-length control protein FliK, partial [Candidatus Obscuribacterales bacterium]|nr:flagellar hook-length control protein FliK [Steroidobacteraceae bacterium]